MRKVAVTGAGGLLGRHVAVRLHAENCAARFRGAPPPWEAALLDRAAFDDDARLAAALDGAALVIHLAGLNRAPGPDLEEGNAALAERLACALAGRRGDGAPVVVYANSVHSERDTPYGRGKRRAAEILAATGLPLADFVLPHVFGEGGRPFYNSVTATFCHQAAHGEAPEVQDGAVELVHAGAVAERMLAPAPGRHRVPGRQIAVPALWARIAAMHGAYSGGIFPDLGDPFDLALFNTYRAHLAPETFPRPLALHRDARGTLFEAAKGGGGGQTFLSVTHPGVTRGDHFHLAKVERFVVVEGEATIRIRPVPGGAVREYHVTGDAPAAVDMPTMHTHSIENTGTGPLLTLFWAHEIFDPARPDTYADPVLA